MRTVSIILVVGLLAGSAHAANYYVSTSGSNGNPGTLAQPFLTIQQAANAAHAGDNVYVMGGTYRETVTVANSGTDASHPITFQPYQGAQVTISGLNPVSSGWTNSGGSIYSAPVTGGASQVFVNGQLMLGARWPNPVYNNPLRAVCATVGSADVQPSPATSTITDFALSGAGNFAGAKMAVTSGLEWRALSTTISSQDGNNLNFQWSYPGDRSLLYPKAGNPYYLYGSLAALSASKQFYYDASAGKLYLNAPGGTNPNGQTVEVRQRQYGFDLGSQNYVNVKGFRLQAASIKIGGNYNTVDHCQILYPRAYEDPVFTPIRGGGVEINGQYNTVRNSEIGYSWCDGVTLTNSHNTIDNNVIHDVNWLGTDSTIVNYSHSGGHQTITNNTMYNCGRDGVGNEGAAPNTSIQHNDISRFGLLAADLGGICSSGTGGQVGSVIAYNRIHDSGTRHDIMGIYLDSHNYGFAIHNNLVYNVRASGITINQNDPNFDPPNNIGVYNNTLSNVGTPVYSYGPPGYVLADVKTYNNLCAEYGSWAGTDVQNNLTASSAFVNPAAGDYTLRTPYNPAIDYGMTDSSHPTDPYTGASPDAGAFELGVTPWTAGANWKTWLFANQTVAPLATAMSVTDGNIRTTAGSLVVGNSGGVNNRAFLKFDLTGVANHPVGRAVLRIYENATDSAAGTVTLYRVTSTWTDGTVNYDQPVGISTSGFYDPANLDMYTDVDVTSMVRDWLSDPSTNFGLVLYGTDGVYGTAKYFDGFYGTTGPQLVITYIPEPSTMVLMGAGLICLLAYARHKRQRLMIWD